MTIQLIILYFLIGISPAQEDPVLQPVRNLFTGMEQADSALVKSAFLSGATMKSVVSSENGISIQEGNLSSFLSAIARSEPGKLMEPIWNIKIEKDGSLAQVWAEYALYVDGKFHHCGVDAFHLVQTGEGWKILLVTDTRRTSPCEVPDEVQQKFKE